MKKNQRPNIIIFNPDQWRGDVLGHMGNPAAYTPNLDKIIQNDAVSFRNAACQNPVCTPSRCSFMTGWYPHTRGHRTMYYMLHPEHNEPNLLKILKENGYYVWWGGKNDLVPGQHGYYGHANKKHHGTKQYIKNLKKIITEFRLYPKSWRGELGGEDYYSFQIGKIETEGENEFFTPDSARVYGAIDFIKKYRKKKPFCIYLPLSFPHPPYGVDEPWFSMIDRNKLLERIKAPKDWKDKAMILKGIWEKQNLQSLTEEKWKEIRATYYGMCAKIDDYFGKIIQCLKNKGIYDNTAVFMFSDHGDYTGDYGLVEKTQNTFEDCLSRVPFIIKPPKLVKVNPGISDAIVELVDFSETVYDLTGIDPNYTRFGKSLIPVIEGDEKEHRDASFCEGGRLIGETQAMELGSSSSNNPKGLYYPRVSLQNTDEKPYHGKAAMCRTKTHKYIRRHYEKDELYDLTKDANELHNVIDDPQYQDIKNQLERKMLSWYMETCDFVPMKEDKRGIRTNPWWRIKNWFGKV